MARAGVVGTAVGLTAGGQPAVLVLVESGGVRGFPAALDGVPVRVVVTGVISALHHREGHSGGPGGGEPTPTPTPEPEGECASTTANYRPACIGISTGHPSITAGTIGARVTGGGNVYALSNNHVYADENLAAIDDAVIQPGTYDGGSSSADDFGTLDAYVVLTFDGSNNTVDAAIAAVDPGDLLNTTPSDGYGEPSRITTTATLGMAVTKYGRTTGQTAGSVYAINVTVNVGYSSGTARFVDQVMITPGSFSDGGDSGSLIVTNDASHNPVGLLFAGSQSFTFANPIDPVLTSFGVTIDGLELDPIPPPDTGGGTISIESVTYSAAGGGGKHLYITVALDDDSAGGEGSPVAGASVTVSVNPGDGSSPAVGTATTGVDGTVTFVWRKAPSGCYTTFVTVNAPAGWDDEQADSVGPDDPFPMGGASCS